jgi:TonB family protein
VNLFRPARFLDPDLEDWVLEVFGWLMTHLGMRRKTNLFRTGGAVLLGCALSTAAIAQEGAVGQPQVQWVKTPSAHLDESRWPVRALRLERDGVAVLKCAYDELGVLKDCRILRDSDPSIGFGAAALRMVRRFKLKPTLSDGSPLKPGEITFPVPFLMKDLR